MFRLYFVEFAKKIRRFAPLCSSIERVQRSENAAAEKSNETSLALLYPSSLLCLRQKRSIELPGVSGRTEKIVATRKRPIEPSGEGKYRQRCARPMKSSPLYLV